MSAASQRLTHDYALLRNAIHSGVTNVVDYIMLTTFHWHGETDQETDTACKTEYVMIRRSGVWEIRLKNHTVRGTFLIEFLSDDRPLDRPVLLTTSTRKIPIWSTLQMATPPVRRRAVKHRSAPSHQLLFWTDVLMHGCTGTCRVAGGTVPPTVTAKK